MSGKFNTLFNVTPKATVQSTSGRLRSSGSLAAQTMANCVASFACCAAISAFALTVLLGASGNTHAAEFQPRVVGGVDVSVDFAPSIVGILNKQRFNTNNSSYRSIFCGGTVIESEWVLTAAHCLIDGNGDEKSPESLLVTMGDNELDGGNETLIDVSEVIVFETYVSTRRGDDIALLRLASPAVVPPTPIEVDDIVLNGLARIAGWGALGDREDGPQQFPVALKGAIVSMVPGAICNVQFPIYTGNVSSRQLCAGVAEGGRDTCQGDSGGPIYKIGSFGELTLAGLTSWGNGCARAESPGIYTRVGAYVDWIRGKIDPDTTPVTVSSNSSSKLLGGTSAFLLLPLLGLALRRYLRAASC